MRYLSTFLYWLLAARLFQLRLHREFPWFTAFIAANALRSAAMIWLEPGKGTYGIAWLLSEPVLLALWVAVCAEVFRRRTSSIHEMGWIRPTLLIGSALLGGGVALTTLLSPSSGWTEAALAWAVTTKRLILLFLLVALGVSVGFLRLFPLRVNRNLGIHTRLLSLYLAVTGGIYWAADWIAPANRPLLNQWLVGFAAAAKLGWILLLRPPDNTTAHAAPEYADPQQLEQAARQFEGTLKEVERKLRP